jgi:arsenate reductase (glutaredoxin)
MFTIYHNPRCAKSREALALLDAHGIAPNIVLYLQTPPTRAQLTGLVAALKLPVRALIRTKEPEYQALNLGDPTLTDKALLDALCQHPKLLERPIVINGNKAVIGRPPIQVLSLIDKAP